MTFLLTVEGFLLNFAFISWELRDRFDSRCTELNVNVTLLLSLTVSLKIHLFNLNFWTGLTDIYVYLERCTNTAALFYRTQDPRRTQDSGRRTTVPGPDLNILIFQGAIPSAAYCHHYQMTSIWNFLILHGSACSCLQVQFSEFNSILRQLRVEAVMYTDIDVSTGPRPLLILFICLCEHNIFVLKYCPNCHILVAIFNWYLRQRWGHLFTSELFVASKVQSCPVKAVKFDT